MIIIYIIIGVVIYVAWGVIKELFFGYSIYILLVNCVSTHICYLYTIE